MYHYTDINGFISIIQNREFWLSHIRFINDRKEYLEGRERCNKIKNEIIFEVVSIALEHLKLLESKNVEWAEIFALNCISKTLVDIFPYLKNEGFKNEDECRIVDNLIYDRNDVPLKIYYRERNGLILLYIKYVLLDMNCRPLKKWSIKEIVVGPGLKQKDVIESVKYFLKN